MGNSRIKTLELDYKRRNKRYKELSDNPITHSAASIAKLGKDYYQSKSYYRLQSKSNVTSEAVLSAH